MSPSLIENCSIELILGLLQLLNFTAEEEVTHMRGRLTHARGRRQRSHRRVGPTPTLVRPSHTSTVAVVILTGAVSL